MHPQFHFLWMMISQSDDTWWHMMIHDDSLFLNEPCLILVLLRGERFIPCQSPWYWLDLTWLLLMEKPLEIQHLLQKWLLEHLPPWKLAAMPFLQHLQINQTWKNEIPSTIFKDGHLYAKIIYKIGKCPAKKIETFQRRWKQRHSPANPILEASDGFRIWPTIGLYWFPWGT